MIALIAVTNVGAICILALVITVTIDLFSGIWVYIHQFALVDVLTLGIIGRWLKSGWTFYGLWNNNGRAVSAIQGTTLVVFE